MAEATLVNIVATYSAEPQIIGLWQYAAGVPAGLQTPAPIEITLPRISNDNLSYRHAPNVDMSGRTYIFNLEAISVASKSENYDIRFFNKYDNNPLTLVKTINEFLVYTAVPYSIVDSTFDTFIVRNRDITPTNKIYFHVVNYAGVATGPIDIEIIYQCYQDRTF
jgi:hypothetical protein